VNPHIHPDGLRDVAAAVHAAGKQLLLWAEPERVRADTPVAKAHPEYFFAPKDPGDKNLLLDLGREDAWQYCFETLSGLIEDLKLDWYRQDFNMDPLAVWRANDAPEREGLSEIGHIGGLYRLWDALLRRFPHLSIDNCASGGRRIDIETLRRSVPLWRSDLQCPESCPPETSQAHALTYAEWLPYSGTGAPGAADRYGLRSCYAPGLGLRCAYAGTRPFADDPDTLSALTQACAEYLRLRPYISADVYALTTPGVSPDIWSAQQFHDPARGGGAALFFRRGNSPYKTARFPLYGLSPAKEYAFTDADTGETLRLPGAALLAEGLPVSLGKAPSSRLYFYKEMPDA
jgi:alpha-galactosidase